MQERSLQTVDADSGSPLTPANAGLPASPSRVRPEGETPSTAPTRESGLEPTESVTRRVDAGPIAALRYQEFAGLPLTHIASATAGETGPKVTATLANESNETWAYRVPRGPAPFAGGRASDGTGELRLAPEAEPAAVTDGVLRPGESVRSAVTASALTGAESGWPEGEFRFGQPLTVWTDDEAFSYHWRVTLRL